MSDVLTFSLPANKSYDVRACTYVRVSDYHGVVEIHEAKSGSRQQPNVRRYAITADDKMDGLGRVYRLTKPKGEDSYYVRLSVFPSEHECQCRAFETGKKCCHIQALEELVKKGAFGKAEQGV